MIHKLSQMNISYNKLHWLIFSMATLISIPHHFHPRVQCWPDIIFIVINLNWSTVRHHILATKNRLKNSRHLRRRRSNAQRDHFHHLPLSLFPLSQWCTSVLLLAGKQAIILDADPTLFEWELSVRFKWELELSTVLTGCLFLLSSYF